MGRCPWGKIEKAGLAITENCCIYSTNSCTHCKCTHKKMYYFLMFKGIDDARNYEKLI